MSNTVTLIGNVTRDPELRFTSSGQPTATFGLAVNRRWQNKQTNAWEEAVSYFNIVTWRELAENCAESLRKGTRAVVSGRLEQRSWEANGEKKQALDVVADEIGPSLRWATAQVHKSERSGSSAAGSTTSPTPAAGSRPSVGATDYASYDEEPF